MAVLCTWSPDDRLLAAVAPLALAIAAGTALVVDLDAESIVHAGGATLAELVAHGPRAVDLRPSRRGVAVLGNGGVGPEEAADVIEALVAGWPHVVFRLPGGERPQRPGVVPVFPLTPLTVDRGPAVYQRGPWPAPRRLEGVMLPRPRASTIRALLQGSRPAPSRWLRAWKHVWGGVWA